MAPLRGLRQRAERLARIMREQGLAGVIKRVRHRIFSRKQSDYRRRKHSEDRAFDGALGVDTGGVQHAYRLQTVGNAVGAAISHVAIPPDEFEAALRGIDLDPASATFIDMGSGKGRALLLAAKMPFRRLIGIEFATVLHETAERNFAALGIATGAGKRVTLLNDDARRFVYPDGQIVLYLYHPFGPPVIGEVAAAALAAWHRGARPMQIAYVNPVHLAEWLARGWQLKERTRTHAILNPPSMR